MFMAVPHINEEEQALMEAIHESGMVLVV